MKMYTKALPKSGKNYICKVQRDSTGKSFLVYDELKTVFFDFTPEDAPNEIKAMKPLGKEYWVVKGMDVDGEPSAVFVRKTTEYPW